MFNLFKKQKPATLKHKYKDLLISLPSNWNYEFEQGGQEACFDPQSQSTLRLNMVNAVSPQDADDDEIIKTLTDHQPYNTTPNGYLLTNPIYREAIDSGKNITLITWKLISYKSNEKKMAVVTYTILSEDKDSSKEKEIFQLIENSLRGAELT